MSFLVNCGGNDSKKVVTTGTQPTCVGHDCPINPTVINGSGFVNTFLEKSNPELYRDVLKDVFAVCDRVQIVDTGDFLESILLSGLASSTNRCSKTDGIAHLDVEFLPNNQANIIYEITDDFGRTTELFKRTVTLTSFTKDDGTRGFFALINNDHGRYSGLSFEFYGNLGSNQFEVDFLYNRQHMINFEMTRSH